ncbi:MAG TPA: ricin-type beta-trefoil lectin domain protein [Actinoplanes sp.]|nr:ricin-type beta-trefoil lectin domain protein [Actinoplanes sp.]
MRAALSSLVLLVAATAVALGPAAPAAAATGPVVDGNARFQVLTPTLIRLEYAGDGKFQDGTTFNAVNRNFPAASYTTSVSGGVREIRTDALTLRYQQGSGPFTAGNLSIVRGGTTAAPVFPSYCVAGAVCQAENALLRGRASTAVNHTAYTGSGFAAGFEATGSGVEQDVSAVPSAGAYRVAVRYANAVGGDGQSTNRTLTVRVNGVAGPRLTLAPTGSWDTWAVASATVSLSAGTNTVAITEEAADSGKVNLDSFAVTPTSDSGYPAAPTNLTTTGYGAGPTSTLGGWSRSLDNPATVPAPEHPGILNRGGWYLLDDTRTALLSASHAVTDRPSHGAQPYQDGYFFGYGTDFKQALADLNALTGPADLLPQSAYGVWFSRYYAYSQADYQTLLARFRSEFTPIDWLVVDTDWKSPSQWNGWNWNSALFPDPQGFLAWTKQQGLSVAMNIHPSIAENDPKFATANAQAGGLTADGTGTRRFDWSVPAQLSAYLNLHRPFSDQGVRTWWLDYCTGCGASTASDPHVAPDNMINQAYADAFGGFSFARIGGAEFGGTDSSYPIGPWSERRNTMQFTGDTPDSWEMLAYEARYAADEAAAGLSNVSHDIGSFHGGHLPDDRYARWVQLGAFQPILRLHSDHGDRLPWDYPGDGGASAARFLRLREALVPYTYTLAHEAGTTGVPIVRPLYLDYPTSDAAYSATGEYLYGDDVLVAPITSASGSTSVWVPPGSWTDYFTGQTFTGPATVTMSAPLSRMPVLIKAGGIMPTRTDYVDNQQTRALSKLTANVAAGADGDFALYQDSTFSWRDGARTLTVTSAADRAYTLRLSNAGAPTAVSVDGAQLPETAWSYNVNSRTVTVVTPSLPGGAAHTITLSGTAAGNPSSGEMIGADGLCLDVRGGVSADGQPVQLYGCNHTAAQQVSLRPDGTVQILGRCLTSAGTIATCAGQTWRHGSDGALIDTATGRCLGGTTASVQVQVSACAGTPAQTWKMPPGPVTGPAGLCADVADADPASGTGVQLWTCNASDAQRWSAPGDRTIRTFGKCLDARNAGTANGTPIQLWDCNGTAAQTWTTRPDGTILNPASNRCLDDTGGKATAGDRLQLYDCNTTAAQRFTLG